MANLRTAIDSAFWDQPVASPKILEGCARSIPGEPFPLDATRASRALRIQQLSLLGNGFPLALIPSYSPPSHKDLGSFSLQTLLLKLASANNWLGVVGQFRPKKLISNIKAEIANAEEFELSVVKDAAKHILDKSLYSIGLSTQFSPTDSTSVLLTIERHGEKKTPRYKMMLFQQLPKHDVTLEAAWPELFIDHKGRYWDVPESISLDMASLVSESGFRYRFGLHKNSGRPKVLDAVSDEPPLALMPGLCAKAAFSYEKKKDIWRKKQTRKDIMEKTDEGWLLHLPYDTRLGEPHAAISGIIGGTCSAWFGESTNGDMSASSRKRNPLNADMFSSLCYTYQHGKFTKDYGDLTRVDARLDLSSVLAITKRTFNNNIFRKSSNKGVDNPMSSPKLNLTVQQQVAGPIVFRVDSRLSLGSSTQGQGLHVEDFICSLNYSLRLLDSGKVVAWYSPKRKEGMIELRLFEF